MMKYIVRIYIVPRVNIITLLVFVSEPPACDDLWVVVNDDAPDSDYIVSMTADDSYGTCAPFYVEDLRKMLLGSGKMWRSTCKKPGAHSLIIEPTVECRGDDWTVQYVTLKLKAVKKVEVYVDNELVFSVSCHRRILRN